MFGGADFNRLTNSHVVVNDRIWAFNFDRLEWSILPSSTMPRPTYFHAAAMNEVKMFTSFFCKNIIYSFSFIQRGEIWTHGGVVVESRSNGDNTNRSEKRITTLYTMHTRVLNLSELAWNSFLSSLPDRTCLIKQPELMVQLDIPPRFIERIH